MNRNIVGLIKVIAEFKSEKVPVLAFDHAEILATA
jgi:hypothetical protein